MHVIDFFVQVDISTESFRAVSLGYEHVRYVDGFEIDRSWIILSMTIKAKK